MPFSCQRFIISEDMNYSKEIKQRIVISRGTFTKKKNLFSRPINKEFMAQGPQIFSRGSQGLFQVYRYSDHDRGENYYQNKSEIRNWWLWGELKIYYNLRFLPALADI